MIKCTTVLAILACLLRGSSTRAIDECPEIMSNAGISVLFPQMVAHGIHSLTVEDLQYYFDKTATEKNGIPTINMDLEAEERLLPHAPVADYDTEFTTVAMRKFDFIMRNMNRTRWFDSNNNLLERMDHTLHMSEIWNQAGEQYDRVSLLLDPHSDICSCVTDIEENDVLNHLNLIAFKLRYPGITSGNTNLTDRYLDKNTRSKRSAGVSWSFGYTAYLPGRDVVLRQGVRPNFEAVDFSLSDSEVLGDVAEKLMDGDDPTIHELDTVGGYEEWKRMNLSAFAESGYYDLAVFLFCMLNQ